MFYRLGISSGPHLTAGPSPDRPTAAAIPIAARQLSTHERNRGHRHCHHILQMSEILRVPHIVENLSVVCIELARLTEYPGEFLVGVGCINNRTRQRRLWVPVTWEAG